MACKLLALDMDGTLLTSDKRIDATSLRALAEAASAGVAVALSTGRGYAELTDYLGEISGIVRYGSLMSGGLVLDFERDEPLFVRPMEADWILRVVEQGAREHAMVHFLTVRDSVAREMDVLRMDRLGMGIYQPMFQSCCTYADDLVAYSREHEGEIVKVNLYHRDTDARERSRAALSDLPVQTVFSEQTSLEVTAPRISKARGLEVLCREVGCTLAETVVAGDGENDLEVLAVAGRAVAMGNAVQGVMAVADAVVATNDEGGIAELVHRFVL